MTKIAHLTTVHSREDIRIFFKQCRSALAAGFDTHLLVADGRGDALLQGIAVYDVGKPNSRRERMTRSTSAMYAKALEVDADIYHLHDAELIPLGRRLRGRGKMVVFDAHEDLPKQILGKHYIPPLVRRPLSRAVALSERFLLRDFEALVGATPIIRDKFARWHPATVNINNYPVWGELAAGEDYRQRPLEVAYVGGISSIRGARELIRALEHVESDVTLNLVGAFGEKTLEQEVKGFSGWKRVRAWGVLDREGVRQVLSRSRAGVVTFLPLPNHIDAQPNKMFEYMSAGLPVIGSNFPLWNQIIEGSRCGLCVDPLAPKQIAAAIDRVVAHGEESEAMGRRGLQAVRDRYNWAAESQKLMDLYHRLAGQRDQA